ncbi:PIG-L deacetylase family protein [Opitutus terrae]|uniref:LmbE family protein n=1 Tax=Opitutus terrae (strain DSM 11246 / JCM 15787 / PB90-1) TaxID=452637 RepID=B1ZY99_OPITP|nr:PIG-L deacetylase family protein [Opitutus terrae]ACB76245.1 LmbE family protein [Opitutus terrae PB90-1]
MSTTTRREFLRAGAVSLATVPLSALAKNPAPTAQPLRIVAVGAHPDDPESGCGGTLKKFSAAGHNVTVLYLTRGEAGIAGQTAAQAAATRTAEAESACGLLGAHARFFGQIDGVTVFDQAAVARMTQALTDLQPDLVLAHWPIDSHPDHQVAATLVIQARLRAAPPFELFFFEVCAGQQTMTFRPTDYVDITDMQEVKRAAVFCHASQNPAEIYAEGGHTLMEQFRGAECGVRAAEAFVRFTARGTTGLV